MSFTLGVPYSGPTRKWAREFNIPSARRNALGVSHDVGPIIRDYLNSCDHHFGGTFDTVETARLPDADELLLAVPDEVWERHGWYPLGGWKPES